MLQKAAYQPPVPHRLLRFVFRYLFQLVVPVVGDYGGEDFRHFFPREILKLPMWDGLGMAGLFPLVPQCRLSATFPATLNIMTSACFHLSGKYGRGFVDAPTLPTSTNRHCAIKLFIFILINIFINDTTL